jgi:hypothetical protein
MAIGNVAGIPAMAGFLSSTLMPPQSYTILMIRTARMTMAKNETYL